MCHYFGQFAREVLELVTMGEVVVKYVDTKSKIANVLTDLPCAAFEKHKLTIMSCPYSNMQTVSTSPP